MHPLIAYEEVRQRQARIERAAERRAALGDAIQAGRRMGTRRFRRHWGHRLQSVATQSSGAAPFAVPSAAASQRRTA